jgi:hypothetical protein
MKIKTSELQGAALDWAVEAAKEVQFNEGRIVKICRQEATLPAWIEVENYPGSAPIFHRSSPSTDWSQGGPIIEREGIFPISNISKDKAHPEWDYLAKRSHFDDMERPFYGPTPLIAAMRCRVASKLGDEVEIPEELLS